MNTCKYCMSPIPDGSFCCASCWGYFEEDRNVDNDSDYEEETEEEDES